jgi:hypothetical protein
MKRSYTTTEADSEKGPPREMFCTEADLAQVGSFS